MKALQDELLVGGAILVEKLLGIAIKGAVFVLFCLRDLFKYHSYFFTRADVLAPEELFQALECKLDLFFVGNSSSPITLSTLLESVI